MPEDIRAKKVTQMYERLKSDRSNWDSQWQEIVDYVLPNRQGFTSIKSAGQKTTSKIYDATAPWANEQLAAALHGMLTSPSIKWFQLRTRKRELMDDLEVAMFLERAENSIYDTFRSPKSNFTPQVHELYLDLCGFGTAVMYVEETFEDPDVMYKTWFLGECVILENHLGMVDTLYRRFTWKARQVVQKWGLENVGKKVQDAYAKDQEAPIVIIHEVKPRRDRDLSREDPKNKPFSSVYVVENEHVLSESGFDKFPFLVPRWSKMAGEAYGRSPSMMALPDIKMLNEMCKTTLRAAQKIVDPPLLVPDDGFMLPIRTTPAGLNFFRMGLGDNQMIRPLETRGNVPLGLEMEQQRREAIMRAYYQDRLKLQKEKVEMTRAEALIRDQENLRMMSPMVGRLEVEFTNELISRTFEIKQRKGAFGEVPAILEGEEIYAEYISPIARAMKYGEAEAVSRAFALIAPMSQMDPQIIDNFDGDAIARSSREWYGLPAKLMKSPGQVSAIRQERAQRAQAEQEKIDTERTAKAGADMAKANQAAA